MARQHPLVATSVLCLLGMSAHAANVTPATDKIADACAALDAAAKPPAMVAIPAGSYRPFFKSSPTDAAASGTNVAVAAFRMDASPVTRGEFLRFLCSDPAWRKSNVKALFAESRYLGDWTSDLDPGPQPLDQPVTQVSWFAARAYCAARDARLPTVVEWERVAGNAAVTNAPRRAADKPFQFAMGTPADDLRHAGLHFDGVWEWNADFNSVAGGGASSSNGGRSSLFCGDGFRSNDASDYAAFLRYSFRNSLRANYTLKNLGFRCVTEAR